jgi:hypothetical protein
MSTPISTLLARAEHKPINFDTAKLAGALSDDQWTEIAHVVSEFSSEGIGKNDLAALLARAPQMWLYNALNHGFAGVPKQSLMNAFRGLLLDLSTSPAN